MQIDTLKIENTAFDVLDEAGIEEPVVDAVKIASSRSIAVKEIEMPENFSDVAGFYNNKEKTIYVAKMDKPVRKLFTVAHELGHIFLGHKQYDVLFRIPKPDVSYTRAEKEANIFAPDSIMLGSPRYSGFQYQQ